MLNAILNFFQSLDADTVVVLLGLFGVSATQARSMKKVVGFKSTTSEELSPTLDRIQRNVEELRMLHLGFMNLNGGGNFLADKSGDYTWVSREWTKMTGLSDTDAVGQGWILGVSESDRFEVNRSWNATVTSNGAIPFAADFTTAAGLPVRGEAVAIESEDSSHPEEITGFFGHILPRDLGQNTGS
jgi:PAS domain-containing protein